MNPNRIAYFIGGGIGALAGAAFLIRDGNFPGRNICIFDSAPTMGGALDGAGDPEHGYRMRGGRMLTLDNYECTWDLFRSIPSLHHPGRSVFEETRDFNEKHPSQARARLVDRRRARVPVASMGFSVLDRIELLRLSNAEESALGASRITDHLSPDFFETPFWLMWSTTFAFQPWHSAVEFRRYLHRFMLEFPRIETLAGVKRTVFNQYDALVEPLQQWLLAQGVRLHASTTVTALEHQVRGGVLGITGIQCLALGQADAVPVNDEDLVFLQNGSMTDCSSFGSMTEAPPALLKSAGGSWSLWEELARDNPAFGRPEVFNSCVAQSCWESFTVTLRDPAFFDQMQRFTGNAAGTGGLVTFRDSNWLMSVVLAHQPHFAKQPEGVQVFWGYGLFPDRIGNFVGRSMADCNGAQILQELCGHLRFDADIVAGAICLPCRMPYITSMFMPRAPGDRPVPVPPGTRNLALISQFVEIAQDTVFTVEYSVRVAQTAVYQLLGIDRPIPPVTPHDKSLRTQFEVLMKAMK